MPKRIIVIPDIHGRSFWKEPVRQYLEIVDKAIFLGDYLDPYRDEGEMHSPEDVLNNLMDIIELKQKNKDKIILLKGNHDEHYSSERFRELAGGTRMDDANWHIYHQLFNTYKELFQLAHLEMVNGVPYLFTHAGITLFWLHKVNTDFWELTDNQLSVTDPEIIERVNMLDMSVKGQELLAVVGMSRSFWGDKTGSILWADIREHSIKSAPKAYGLDQVFQVFGHTRLDGNESDMIDSDCLAMIDSQKCFMIAEEIHEKIIPLKDYVERHLHL